MQALFSVLSGLVGIHLNKMVIRGLRGLRTHQIIDSLTFYISYTCLLVGSLGVINALRYVVFQDVHCMAKGEYKRGV